MSKAPKQSDATNRRRGLWVYAAVWLIVCVAYTFGIFEFLDRKIQDIRFIANDRTATGDIVVVEIDAWSLTEFNGWPWPRRHFAEAIDNLSEAGAKRVLLDVDFSSYSEYESDQILAAAILRAKDKVVLPIFQQLTSSAGNSAEVLTSRPLSQFEENATLAGINIFPSPDGMVREMSYHQVIEGDVFPMLATEMAKEKGARFYRRNAYQIDYGINPATFPHLSMADVVRGRFDPSVVAGKQVIIGATAVSLGDQLGVPLHLVMPGVYVHALAYESLAQGRALQPFGIIETFGLLLILVVIVAASTQGLSLLRGHMACVGLVALIAASSVIVQDTVPLIIDIAPMIAAIVFTYYITIFRQINVQAMRLLFQSSDIRRKETMIHNLVENSTVGIIAMDVSGEIETINKSAAAMFGGRQDEIVGTNIDGLVSRNDLSEGKISDYLIHLPITGTQEVVGHREGHDDFLAEITFSKVDVEDDIVMTGFVNDITLRKQQEESLQYRATHDLLTGLLNRDAFSQEVDKRILEAGDSSGRVAVFLLDLDRFKEVNDTLGHRTGDKLLQLAASRFTEESPEQAVFARFGGDEFAVMLPQAENVEVVSEFAKTMLETIGAPYELDDLRLEVGGSIGATVFPEHGGSAEELIQRADIAMYVAKQEQTGYSIYAPEADVNSVQNLTLTGDLRHAIETSELDLVFQPKVNVSKRQVIGVEVLSRWIRPEHGPVSPDEFVSHAEQTGLIFPMTEWVMDKALEEVSAWRLMGIDLNVAINLSARLINNPAVLPAVVSLLEKWDYPPNRLTLEITENALVANPKAAMAAVERFSQMGIRVSIDDFGTGYSSLEYLKSLKVQELKIDKSFVLNLTEDQSDRTIVKSVIGLAHDLGLKVVAEGIESLEALDVLDQLSCDVGQGYLFARPMPAPDFIDWMKSAEWNPQGKVDSAKTTGRRTA